MSGVQFAKFIEKRCPMSDPVCYEKVLSLFAGFTPQGTTPEWKENMIKLIEEKCGRYVKGKNKGQIRGWAHIRICSEGGWEVLGPGAGNGRVVYPGTIMDVMIRDFNGNVYIGDKR